MGNIVGHTNHVFSLAVPTILSTLCEVDSAKAVVPRRLRELPSWLLSQAGLRSHALLTEALTSAGARGYHYRLLAALADLGPTSQATLGRATGLDRSDVTAVIGDLVERGAVTLSRSNSDRRSHTVGLTTGGRRWLDELDQIVAAVQTQLLAPLSDSERRDLVRLLSRIQPPPPSPPSRTRSAHARARQGREGAM